METKQLPSEFMRFQMKATGEADVYIFEDIGENWTGTGITAKAFVKEFDSLLKKNPTNINIHLNSNGGSVSDGIAIANTIKRVKDKTTVYVDGFAASIASIIALAGSKNVMASNALFMIHNPKGFAMGDSRDMAKMGATLDTVKEALVSTYTEKTGKSAAEIAAKMDAETWFTAQEAKEYGFADEVMGESPVLNQVSQASWNAWNSVRNQVRAEAQPIAGETSPDQPKETCEMSDTTKEGPKPATIAELKAACAGATSDFICAMLEQEATVADAMKAYQKVQADVIAEQTAKIEALQKKAEKPAAPVVAVGVEPLKETIKAQEPAMEPEAEWLALIHAKITAGMPKKQATITAARENPDLHRAYLEAYNGRFGREVK